MYKFALLDPRPIPAAVEANEKVFVTGPVYGIEVTVPALAALCIYNLDPQHSGGDASTAAIEAALTEELPLAGTTLATVRADLDAVGAMAVFALRAEGVTLSPETYPVRRGCRYVRARQLAGSAAAPDPGKSLVGKRVGRRDP
jgi:hypothetical protein